MSSGWPSSSLSLPLAAGGGLGLAAGSAGLLALGLAVLAAAEGVAGLLALGLPVTAAPAAGFAEAVGAALLAPDLAGSGFGTAGVAPGDGAGLAAAAAADFALVSAVALFLGLADDADGGGGVRPYSGGAVSELSFSSSSEYTMGGSSLSEFAADA